MVNDNRWRSHSPQDIFRITVFDALIVNMQIDVLVLGSRGLLWQEWRKHILVTLKHFSVYIYGGCWIFYDILLHIVEFHWKIVFIAEMVQITLET